MTIERIQKLAVITTLLCSLTWGAISIASGSPMAAAAIALALPACYACVLFLEFGLLAANLAHNEHGLNWTRCAALLFAWMGEVRISLKVFCWSQPFRSRRSPDHLPNDGDGRRGVLLVHGYFCNRGIWSIWLDRLGASGTPFVALSMNPPFGSISDYDRQIEGGVHALEVCTGLPPVIVAHSMGGLAVRRWWANRAGPPSTQYAALSHLRVHRLITLGTPHHGTWMARLALTRNGREMREHSPWLETLFAEEPAAHRERAVCFRSACDNIVFPERVASLQGADNRLLDGVAHVAMVNHPGPWAELLRQLSDASVSRESALGANHRIPR